MEPIFTMQYGEFAVVDYLSKEVRDASVFVPASAQEKGIDLLLYRFIGGHTTTNTIQVKMSRTYYIDKPRKRFRYICGLTVSKFKKMQIGTFWLFFLQSSPKMLMLK